MNIPSTNSIKKKINIILVVMLLLFAVIVGRMAWLQLVRGNELSKTVRSQQTSGTAEQAARGKILDRNGKVLAESASVNTLVCNPQDVKSKNGDLNACISILSPILGMSENELRKALTVNYQYSVIKKRLSAEESNAIDELINPVLEPETDDTDESVKAENKRKKDIKKKLYGVYFENDSKRFYPYNVASHVLGYTGNYGEGIQGLEQRLDDYLTGKNGSVEKTRSASGTTIEEQQQEYLTASERGADVTLTIDETIQHILEKKLEESVVKNELKEGAAGVIMNPKTGEILAISTKPDFDCNNPYDITQFLEYAVDFVPEYSDDDEYEDEPRPTEDPENLSDEFIAQARSKMWRDKAVSDTYEPGSTFKIITAAAALEENIVNENSSFYCPGYKQVADRKIGCANKHGHGAQNFVQAVKNSCNPAFMEIGLGMGETTFMNYFRSFGFTQKTGIELGGESSGIYYDKMNEVDLATSSFGQGFQITTLQLITAVSAVINGGERMKPHIIKEITDGNGTLKKYEPEVVNRVISEETSKTMREILEQVVADPNATGKNAYVKGYRIGGKTGTSEKNPRGSDKRIASFIGFAPANDPELICLVMFDEPQTANKYGGTIAAPVVGEILSESLNYLGVPKQYTENEIADEYVTIPDFRGMTREAAREAVKSAGLDYMFKGSGDTVTAQLPYPDEMFEKGSVVIMYTDEFEEGDEGTVTVPDLTGRSVSDAKIILHRQGLNFEISGAGHSEAGNAYAVAQTIEPGKKVKPGTIVGVRFGQQTND